MSLGGLPGQVNLPVCQEAQVAKSYEAPGRVAGLAEAGHYLPDLLGILEGAAVYGLLLEGPEKSLEEAIVLGLLEKGLAAGEAPELKSGCVKSGCGSPRR